MFRHGVRTWYTNFPKEPIDPSIWDQYGGFAQLTSAGVKQLTEFGAFFGDYYRDQITFDASKVYAKSTFYNRTLKSSQAFLNGLFGINSIPISMNPTNVDKVLNNFFTVIKYIFYMSQFFVYRYFILTFTAFVQDTNKSRLIS